MKSTALPAGLSDHAAVESTPSSGLSAAQAELAERLDALLPQTQCTRCGYPDCRGYAAALARGETALNRCPPGGQEGVRRLAAALAWPLASLDPSCGVEARRKIVFIDEPACIGCTLCIQACPVDAIVGAPKRMHTVIESTCTGCELCLPVCPVDCIQLENVGGEATGWAAWSPTQADAARARYLRRRERLEREAREQTVQLATRTVATPDAANTQRQQRSLKAATETAEALSPLSANHVASALLEGDGVAPGRNDRPGATDLPTAPAADPKRAAIEAALARARARLGHPK